MRLCYAWLAQNSGLVLIGCLQVSEPGSQHRVTLDQMPERVRALPLWKSFGNRISSSAAKPVCCWVCCSVVANTKSGPPGSKLKVPLLFNVAALTCPFFQEGGQSSVQQVC